jgi:uncharacterized protein YeaO (DUF488 family)
MTIHTERVYELGSATQQPHFLVDRIWPRGVKKEELQLTDWLKEVAPSTELRKWFNHEPEKWDAFQKRYFAEPSQKKRMLSTNEQSGQNLREQITV